MFERPDRIAHPLYVVTSVFNSQRFRSRWSLYEKAAKRIEDAGAVLYTVEVAFGDRALAVTDPTNRRHIQLRTLHELWLKENAINIGVQHLTRDHPDWRYLLIYDADVTIVRHDWVGEALHQLQHFPVIQPYTRAVSLGPTHEPIGNRSGIAASWLRYGDGLFASGNSERAYGRTGWGLIWGFRREAWDGLGGLIDFSILGGGDWFMGHALFGRVDVALQRRRYHARYAERIYDWQRRAETTQWAERPLIKNVGVVEGLALHHYHGPVEGRQYKSRAQLLVDEQFNPDVDLKYDAQGLLQLTSANPRLRRTVQGYFRRRNEDAV